MFDPAMMFPFGLLALAYLPALLLPPVPTGSPTRRDDVALSAAVVLVLLAVVATLYAGYMAFVLPPFFSWCLAAAVAGIAGKRAAWYGPVAGAVYTLILVVLALSPPSGFNTRAVVQYAGVTVLAGVVGCLPVRLIWWVRGKRDGRR